MRIIENVQRADLNALEEAMGYEQLISEFGYGYKFDAGYGYGYKSAPAPSVLGAPRA